MKIESTITESIHLDYNNAETTIATTDLGDLIFNYSAEFMVQDRSVPLYVEGRTVHHDGGWLGSGIRLQPGTQI